MASRWLRNPLAWMGSLFLTATIAALANDARADAVGKVQICHFPPGNPANFHTLTVGAPAVPAHLAHGDSLGACEETDCHLFASLCDDGNPCTTDICDSRTRSCLPHVPVDCDDGNPCTADSCNPATGGCENSPRSGSCDDSDSCTPDDHCVEGRCFGTPTPGCCIEAADCDDLNGCTNDSCTGGQCEHSAVTCDDGNACTVDTCNPTGGACVFASILCDDANPCTVDSCDPTNGCLNQPTSCQCTLGSDQGDSACSVILPCCDQGMACGADGSCHTSCVEPGGQCSSETGTCCSGLACSLGVCEACFPERTACDGTLPCCAGLVCDQTDKVCLSLR